MKTEMEVMQKCNGDDTASEAWHLRQPVDVPCGVNDIQGKKRV